MTNAKNGLKKTFSYLELQHVEVGFGVQPDFPIIGLYKMPGINAMKPNTCDLVTVCVIKQPSTLCIWQVTVWKMKYRLFGF